MIEIRNKALSEQSKFAIIESKLTLLEELLKGRITLVEYGDTIEHLEGIKLPEAVFITSEE